MAALVGCRFWPEDARMRAAAVTTSEMALDPHVHLVRAFRSVDR
jgi:hypothetical protein